MVLHQNITFRFCTGHIEVGHSPPTYNPTIHPPPKKNYVKIYFTIGRPVPLPMILQYMSGFSVTFMSFFVNYSNVIRD